MCYTKFAENLKLQLYIVGNDVHAMDQYSDITHCFLSISIFVNYLSGCKLRQPIRTCLFSTNCYMPIIKRSDQGIITLLCYVIGRVAIDRNGEECSTDEV